MWCRARVSRPLPPARRRCYPENMSLPPDYRPAFHPLPSAHASVVWPALPAPNAALTAALLQQLEQSQWWTPEQLAAQQLRQAGALLDHAYRHIPFYRERLAQAGHLPGKTPTPDVWSRIPVLSRAELQQAGDALYSPEIPQGHGETYELSTSGSTGRPLTARGTVLAQLFFDVLTLRELLWHRRDLGGALAAIRSYPNGVADYPEGAEAARWGRSMKGVFETGPSFLLSIASPIEEQVEWLHRKQPDYLLTYPSALREMLLHCRARGITFPRLREVRTISEQLAPSTRDLCREVWGLKIVDMYSTQENGYLAFQCPAQEHYHVQSESVLLEVLNEAGEPCRPGEVGQVVVTPLMNFAMPMIRYAVGDLAEAGAPCPCGRGLPVLNRILGRARDMLVYPGGRRSWALMGSSKFTGIPVVRQFQIVQHAVDDLELKIVAERSLTRGEEDSLRGWILERCGHPFPLRITYHREIPRGPGGKFHDFRCAIPEMAERPGEGKTD